MATKNLSLTNLMSNKYEPKRQNRWVLSFTLTDWIKNVVNQMGGDADSFGEELAFAAHTANRPEVSYEQTETHRINERFYYAGKPTWNELVIEFYDFVNGPLSASNAMWLWNTAIYNPLTGSMGYKMNYSTQGTLSLLDPEGGVAESWGLFYLWPATINWNELSAESSDVMNVTANFRYDYAILGTTSNAPKYDGT